MGFYPPQYFGFFYTLNRYKPAPFLKSRRFKYLKINTLSSYDLPHPALSERCK